jgi:hypothetical protein
MAATLDFNREISERREQIHVPFRIFCLARGQKILNLFCVSVKKKIGGLQQEDWRRRKF